MIQNLPSNAEVNQFLMLRELVTGLYDEMKDFAKKSANETLNEFKIKSLNRVLTPLKELMKDQPTALFLDFLEESSLPTNSDVVIMLVPVSQSNAELRRQVLQVSSPFFYKEVEYERESDRE